MGYVSSKNFQSFLFLLLLFWQNSCHYAKSNKNQERGQPKAPAACGQQEYPQAEDLVGNSQEEGTHLSPAFTASTTSDGYGHGRQ
jgi:hypothetical protein